MSKRLISLFLFAFFLSESYAQKCYDIDAKAPAYVLTQDSAIHILHDTTFTICKNYILLTQNNGYNFYKKLIQASEKHVLLKEIYQMALSSPPPDTLLEKKNMIKAEDVYSAYSGKPISRIRIKVLKPFGPTIADTTRPVVTYVEKSLNPTHINTRDKIIKKKLLFKEHDTIDPLLLVENARILTNLNYLQDAAIVVKPAQGDSVDIWVLVKDKFPWLAIPNIYNANKYGLYLKQGNILGLGQSAGVGLLLDTKSDPKFYLSEANYSINNLYKQIDVGLSYSVSNNNQKIGAAAQRQLVPTKVNLAGAIEISQTAENIITDPTYIDQSQYYFKYMYYDVWASYLIPLNKIIKQASASNVYFIPGARFSKKNYNQRPVVNLDTNSQYYNYDFIIGNLVIAKQDYYRTNYLVNFGKAEYLPYGFQVSLTAGYSWTEFMKKPYAGVSASSTWHFDKVGFVFGKLDLGSHFSHGSQQGAAHINLLHLTDLMVNNSNHKFRIKTELTLTAPIHRFTNDLLYLGDKYGFVGLNNKTFYGQQRSFIETTVIDFTPFFLFGFRVAFLGFINAGTIGPNDIPLQNRQLLTNFGVGAYIRNDFLIFNSFEIKIAYFPVTPDGVNHIGFSFTSENLLNKLNFLSTKPEQVRYQ